MMLPLHMMKHAVHITLSSSVYVMPHHSMGKMFGICQNINQNKMLRFPQNCVLINGSSNTGLCVKV